MPEQTDFDGLRNALDDIYNEYPFTVQGLRAALDRLELLEARECLNALPPRDFVEPIMSRL